MTISGVLSCFDRLLITGPVPEICYAEGMTRFLFAKGIRILDVPQFVQTLRDRVRDRAAALASEAGLTSEHRSKGHVLKEEVVARVLAQRGDHHGLVHVTSAMEACDSYRPWHDKGERQDLGSRSLDRRPETPRIFCRLRRMDSTRVSMSQRGRCPGLRSIGSAWGIDTPSFFSVPPRLSAIFARSDAKQPGIPIEASR